MMLSKILVFLLISTSSFSQEFDELILAGEELAYEWETEKTMALFTQAIEIRPESAEAYYMRGFAASISNPTLGIDDFLKAIELDASHEMAYSRASSYYSFVGKFDTAKIYTKKAIELNPNSAGNLMSQAEIEVEDGNFAQAIELLNRSIELEDDALEWLALVDIAKAKYLNQDYKGSCEDFERAINDFPIGMYMGHQYELCGDAYEKCKNMVKACEMREIGGTIAEMTEESSLRKGKNNCSE